MFDTATPGARVTSAAIALIAASIVISGPVEAQQPQAADASAQGLPPSTNPAQRVIYPGEGQSQEQQMKDQLECYNWATTQSQWDPYKAYAVLEEKGYVAQQQANAATGGAVRGAAGGALMGLAIGAIAGDAGQGAAIGAVAGGMTGGMRSRRQRMAAQSQMEQAIQQFQQQFQVWDRNYVACMQGRKYTVN